ncbi:Endogenous retrovirus group FC1 Env polyprotein [Plecturocebus cupreus]
MGYSVTSAAQLENKLHVAIEASSASLASLQRQITSLAQEECCYYINESGLVEENINTLDHLQENLHKKQNTEVLSLSWFLQTRMQEIGRVVVNQMLLHPFVRFSVEAPAN